MTWRPLQTALVDDPDYQALSPPARALLVGVKLSLPPEGVGRLYGEQLDDLAGVPHAEPLKELKAGGWVKTRRGYVWLVKGFRWELSHRGKSLVQIRQRMTTLLPNPLVLECWERYRQILGAPPKGRADSPPEAPPQMTPPIPLPDRVSG